MRDIADEIVDRYAEHFGLWMAEPLRRDIEKALQEQYDKGHSDGMELSQNLLEALRRL